jgi:hypothetical protein
MSNSKVKNLHVNVKLFHASGEESSVTLTLPPYPAYSDTTRLTELAFKYVEQFIGELTNVYIKLFKYEVVAGTVTRSGIFNQTTEPKTVLIDQENYRFKTPTHGRWMLYQDLIKELEEECSKMKSQKAKREKQELKEKLQREKKKQQAVNKNNNNCSACSVYTDCPFNHSPSKFESFMCLRFNPSITHLSDEQKKHVALKNAIRKDLRNRELNAVDTNGYQVIATTKAVNNYPITFN